jgi:hypothetical protein
MFRLLVNDLRKRSIRSVYDNRARGSAIIFRLSGLGCYHTGFNFTYFPVFHLATAGSSVSLLPLLRGDLLLYKISAGAGLYRFEGSFS